MTKSGVDLAITLRQVKSLVIEVECGVCDRRGGFDRKELVKRHGSGMTLGKLKRVAALGCERLVSPEGDRCGTCFPTLTVTIPKRTPPKTRKSDKGDGN